MGRGAGRRWSRRTPLWRRREEKCVLGLGWGAAGGAGEAGEAALREEKCVLGREGGARAGAVTDGGGGEVDVDTVILCESSTAPHPAAAVTAVAPAVLAGACRSGGGVAAAGGLAAGLSRARGVVDLPVYARVSEWVSEAVTQWVGGWVRE